MLKGPNGEKRPADVIGAAVTVMKIATGEIAEDTAPEPMNSAATKLGRRARFVRACRRESPPLNPLPQGEGQKRGRAFGA
jgi:hypothetical protein